MEWDGEKQSWVPVLDEAAVRAQQAAYSVEGVDEEVSVWWRKVACVWPCPLTAYGHLDARRPRLTKGEQAAERGGQGRGWELKGAKASKSADQHVRLCLWFAPRLHKGGDCQRLFTLWCAQ